MTPEKKIQNSIINYFKELEKLGYYVYVERRQAGGLSYKKGQPDLYAVCYGKHIEIEIKAPDGKRSPLQEKWETRCKKLKILYCLAYDLEDVKNFIYFHFNIKI